MRSPHARFSPQAMAASSGGKLSSKEASGFVLSLYVSQDFLGAQCSVKYLSPPYKWLHYPKTLLQRKKGEKLLLNWQRPGFVFGGEKLQSVISEDVVQVLTVSEKRIMPGKSFLRVQSFVFEDFNGHDVSPTFLWCHYCNMLLWTSGPVHTLSPPAGDNSFSPYFYSTLCCWGKTAAILGRLICARPDLPQPKERKEEERERTHSIMANRKTYHVKLERIERSTNWKFVLETAKWNLITQWLMQAHVHIGVKRRDILWLSSRVRLQKRTENEPLILSTARRLWQ